MPPARALPGSRVREILADSVRGSVIRTVRIDSWVWAEINRLDRMLEPFTGGRKASAIMRAALARGLEYDALSRLHAGDLTRADHKTTTTRLPAHLVERVLAAMVDGENEASVTRAAIEIGLPELRAELAKAAAEAILEGASW